MTRQYIGARYVPAFKGTYNATTVYEALDVVDDGLGTSYIAKIPVPAGTSLTDPTYWAVYGSSNGAIISLQNRMTNAEGDITNLQLDISMLQGSILGLNNDIGTINGDISTINGDITSLQNAIAGIESGTRRVVIISDSYGLVRGGNTPWTDYFETISGLTSGVDYFDFSEGSMGFNRSGDGGHTALTLLQAHSGDIIDHDSITDVIFGLGINDISATAGLDTAIANTISYVKTNYPIAKIWIGYISNQETKATAVLNNYISSVNIYKTAAEAYGAAYITDVEYVMHNWQFFQADGIHPTSSGCRAIAGFVDSFLKGGASYTVKGSSQLTGAYLNSTYAKLDQTLDGPVSRFSLTMYAFVANCTLNAGAAVKIASLDNPILGGSGGDSYGGLCFITVSGDLVPFSWFVYAGDLYLQNLNSTTAYTIASGTTVRLFTANAPTLVC